MRTRLSLVPVTTLALLAMAVPLQAQRTGYPPEEFAARRKALAAELKEGLVLLVGKTMPNVATREHQNNDFYYFTGNEDLNAVLVMNAGTGEAHLFLPQQTEGEVRADGPNWLAEPDAPKRYGFTSIQPLSAAAEFLFRQRADSRLWTRMQEADEVDDARGTRAVHQGRRMQNPFSAQLSEDVARIELLRTRFPTFELRDLTPAVDRLRMIKTPREIEVLKTNGKIAAEAVVNAIKATRPGGYEYELEAEATYHHVRHGVQIAGYPAIVGAGKNGLVWHYQDNGKRLEPGETIVMDYGGALDYEVIDITRTWPVSGQFDDLQRRAYACVLEAQKAGIAAMRAGNTRKQTREIAEAVFKKHGFDPRWAGGAGHFVGMSVHDVGDASLPFAPGMVIAIEPILQIPDKNLHVRIEDTVLITDGDPVVLTAAAPKEIDELLALIPRTTGEPSR